jgi:D-alanine transaminase
MSHIAYVNGRYLPQKQAQVHIEDRGYQFADGVYEVMCVWNGFPVDYGPHIVRLNRSLRELRMTPPVSDAGLKLITQEVVRRNRLEKGTIYIQVNRGVAPRAHIFPGAHIKPSLVVTAKHGAGPSDDVAEEGVAVITAPDLRWARRDIKSVGLLPNALAKQAAAESRAYEALLVTPDGLVTEASAANAWIVTKDKVLITHPTTHAILGGITRATVLKMALRAGYAVEERGFTLDEARAAKEVFLTGTTAFVMPVTSIDGKPVANGGAGTISLDLRRRYKAYLETLTQRAWHA